MIRALAFFIGALVVTTVVHVYVHRRLVRDLELAPRWARRARVGIVLLASLLPAGMVGLLMMRTAPRWSQSPLMWCAFVWVGVLLFLLPLLFASEALRVRPPRDPARRRAMSRLIAGACGVASLALGGASMVVAQRPLRVRRFRIPLPKLGASMRGFKVVQISDVHVSATIGSALVGELVSRVNELDADLVVVTGDLVDGSVEELGPIVMPFANLRSKHGVYFVAGNHEYLSGAPEWVAFVSSTLGFRVLDNAHVSIGGADGFDLVGIDDPSGAPDLEKALAGRDDSRASILLAHRPDDVARAVHHGIGLQLSGHTHGGQIPIGWLLERAHQPYVFGLYEIGETFLYVTSGAGYWGPPMRLATHAEIAVFELVTA